MDHTEVVELELMKTPITAGFIEHVQAGRMTVGEAISKLEGLDPAVNRASEVAVMPYAWMKAIKNRARLLCSLENRNQDWKHIGTTRELFLAGISAWQDYFGLIREEDGGDILKWREEWDSLGTDPVRMKLLAGLINLSLLDPNQRFGQLIANLVTHADEPFEDAQWDIPDSVLLACVEQNIAFHEGRASTMIRRDEPDA